MKHYPKKTACFSALFTILLSAIIPTANASLAYPEYNVKAELVFRIAEFIEWPPETFENDKRFKIAIFGNNPFGKYIFSIARNEKIHNCPVQIVEISRDTAIGSEFQVIFVDRFARDKLAIILKSFATKPVLILSDTEECVSAGAHIGFNVVKEKIRFSINLDSAAKSGLHFSSGLLRLANKIYGISQK